MISGDLKEKVIKLLKEKDYSDPSHPEYLNWLFGHIHKNIVSLDRIESTVSEADFSYTLVLKCERESINKKEIENLAKVGYVITGIDTYDGKPAKIKIELVEK